MPDVVKVRTPLDLLRSHESSQLFWGKNGASSFGFQVVVQNCLGVLNETVRTSWCQTARAYECAYERAYERAYEE